MVSDVCSVTQCWGSTEFKLGNSGIKPWSPRGCQRQLTKGASWNLDPGPPGKSDPVATSQPAPPHCRHAGAAVPQSWAGLPLPLCLGRNQGQRKGSPRHCGRTWHRGRSIQSCSIYVEFLKTCNWLPAFKNQEVSYPNSDFQAFLKSQKIGQH